jgi:hypothetical protein
MPNRLISSLLVSLCLLGYPGTSFGAPPKNNVVFVLADDLGVNDLSLYGSKFSETPNIDTLAKRGM